MYCHHCLCRQPVSLQCMTCPLPNVSMCFCFLFLVSSFGVNVPNAFKLQSHHPVNGLPLELLYQLFHSLSLFLSLLFRTFPLLGFDCLYYFIYLADYIIQRVIFFVYSSNFSHSYHHTPLCIPPFLYHKLGYCHDEENALLENHRFKHNNRQKINKQLF